MFTTSDNLDWELILELVGLLAEVLPDLLADFALVCFGIFPSDEDRQRNEKYEGEHAFLRDTLNIAKVHDIMGVFAEQNDYLRLARPFWNRMRAQGREALSRADASPKPTRTSSSRGTARPKSTSTDG